MSTYSRRTIHEEAPFESTLCFTWKVQALESIVCMNGSRHRDLQKGATSTTEHSLAIIDTHGIVE